MCFCYWKCRPTCELGSKPVGEVHVAVATKKGTITQKFSLKNDRKHIQRMCVLKLVSKSFKV
jgi:nicotinamide mononucleotide (NMN) deamidase PncC